MWIIDEANFGKNGNNRCEYILGRKINRAVPISCMEARGAGINFTKISDAQEDK